MLAGGEDPLFIFRRMLILAAEDISLADPQALMRWNDRLHQAGHAVALIEEWCASLAVRGETAESRNVPPRPDEESPWTTTTTNRIPVMQRPPPTS